MPKKSCARCGEPARLVTSGKYVCLDCVALTLKRCGLCGERLLKIESDGGLESCQDCETMTTPDGSAPVPRTAYCNTCNRAMVTGDDSTLCYGCGNVVKVMKGAA